MDSPYTRFLYIQEKFLLYADALSQYYRLGREDQKIITPYIENLKKAWQADFHAFKMHKKIAGK